MNNKLKKPPANLIWLLGRMIDWRVRYDALGEYEEKYYSILDRTGHLFAIIWYLAQLVIVLPNFVFSSIFRSTVMLKNYFIIALRNIKKQKTYSFINIAGLAVGIACCILIMLWVQDELSYDGYQEKLDNLYRVVDYETYSNGEEFWWTTNAPELGPKLKSDFPEVIDSFRAYNLSGRVVKNGKLVFYENSYNFADKSILNMLDFDFIAGDPQTALDDPFSVVISRKIAEKYFNSTDVLGESLTIDNRLDFKITGIISEMPSNSHLKFDMLSPFLTLDDFGFDVTDWGDFRYKTYLLLDNNVNGVEFGKKIKNYLVTQGEDKIYLALQSYKDIHLQSEHLRGAGSLKTVYLFFSIAVLILFTALINYINLTTARSANRAKEVGLRKTIGAKKAEIVSQFYIESMVYAIIASVLALVIVNLALPYFNSISAKQLTFNLFGNFGIAAIILGTTVLSGLISGSYPALVISAYQPANILKGTVKSGAKQVLFRRVLVITQFALSITLIISTFVLNEQLKFARNYDLGYNKEKVLDIALKGGLRKSVDLIKNQLKDNPAVVNISASSSLPTSVNTSMALDEWEGSEADEYLLLYFQEVDYDYLETLKIELLEGRFFSEQFSSDTTEGIIVNETAVKAMGMESPLGKTVMGGRIIGIVKDFHFSSLRAKIKPLAIVWNRESYRHLLLRLHADNITESLDSIKETWGNILPDYPFEYKFLDDEFDKQYRTDIRIEKVFNSFTVLALFISCLGLFGLAAFLVEQRRKEIGIRKTLGASVPAIVKKISIEFFWCVIAANIIAWPVAFILIDKFLGQFAYKTEISILIYIFAGAVTLVIAFLTISFQIIRAARANPVDSLKYE